jgi:type III secretory pathway component EscT
MADINVDTQSAAYQARHTQFQEIVSFWRPILQQYLLLPEPAQIAWRAADPFLNDLLRFAEAVTKYDQEAI